MIPKSVKRRFKAAFGDDNRQPNNNAMHDEGMFTERPPHNTMDDPVTNFAQVVNDEEEMKQSELLGRNRSTQPYKAPSSGFVDSVTQLKDSISEDTRNLFNGVGSGLKNIKEKVVGKSAKKAHLVEEEEEEDPCHYESLQAENPNQTAGSKYSEQKQTKTVWTPQGPVEVDEHGMRIASKKVRKGAMDASQDESDGQERSVDILAYGNLEDVKLDPNVEDGPNNYG